MEKDVPLSFFTTLGIGGNADFLITASDLEQLKAAVAFGKENSLPLFVLGGGSNVVISDKGWRGVVLMPMFDDLEMKDIGGGITAVTAGAGINWDHFVAVTVEKNLQGIECLSGIPGNVGASPIQNIGAYGQEVKDTIEWVEVLDRESLETKKFSNSDCDFDYRMSRFKAEDKDRYIVCRVCFHLKHNGAPALRYGDVVKFFESQGILSPSLADIRDAILNIRRQKGMVYDKSMPDSISCGSFFMNPILPTAYAEKVREIALEKNLINDPQRMPFFPQADGTVKLSAAWLMEQAGIPKGYCYKNVGISSRHVLALVCKPGGTAVELKELAEWVQKKVSESFGVELHPEPNFIG